MPEHPGVGESLAGRDVGPIGDDRARWGPAIHAGIAIAVVETSQEHVWCNEPYGRFIGRPAGEVVGIKLADALGDPADLSAGWENVVAGHRLAFEVCLTALSGDIRYGLVDVNRFEDEVGFRVVVSIQDQTAARHALTDLQRYYSMVAYSMDAIISLDPSGNVATWNAGAQNLYGYTADEILGHALTTLSVGESESFLADLAGRVMDGEVVEGEVQQRCRNGTELWVSTQASPIYHRVEGISGVLLIARDVTHRREMEEELRAAKTKAEEAAVAKSRFLANMSHEIRTPMNGILGMTDLLLDTSLSTEQLQYAETVKTSGVTLLELINDILDFSKIEAGHLELESIPFDVTETLDGVLDVMAQPAARKGLELTGFADLDVPSMLVGDPGRLRQVLLNLTNNAVKFTSEGGVALRVQRADGRHLRFEVEDSGIGIPQSRRRRLFKAFSQVDASTTRRFGGTGLGLAICRELVEIMGGSLAVDSEEGVGSTFWFTLELLEATAGAVDSRGDDARWSTPRLDGHRILIVDDSVESRRILRKYCEAWGAEVVTAPDGAAATSAMTEALDAGVPFTIALLDHGLGAHTGLMLGRRWREEGPKTPMSMTLMASYADSDAAKEAVNSGFDGYLMKPIKRAALAEQLKLALGSGRRPALAERRSAFDGHGVSDQRRQQTLILVVEDNVVNQKVTLGMLRRLGYPAVIAPDGAAAVKMFSERPYDVVLMDCQMPRMDGYQATAVLRSLNRAGARVPIVAMTANAMVGDREACMAAGMDYYLSKPISVQSLCSVLEQVLSSGRVEHAG